MYVALLSMSHWMSLIVYFMVFILGRKSVLLLSRDYAVFPCLVLPQILSKAKVIILMVIRTWSLLFRKAIVVSNLLNF